MSYALMLLEKPIALVREAIIQSFGLSSEEEAEALELNLNFDITLNTTQEEELEELARTTTNAGLQYLFLGNDNLLLTVVGSKHLDSRVVSLILNEITNAKLQGFDSPLSPAVFTLLTHKIVVSDVKLFKRALMTFETSNHLPSTQVKVNDFLNFYYPLHFHSVAEGKESNAMSIETLLFILAHLHRNEKFGIETNLAIVRDKALKLRKIEIKEWVDENIPDCAGLPMPWILKVADLYIDL